MKTLAMFVAVVLNIGIAAIEAALILAVGSHLFQVPFEFGQTFFIVLLIRYYVGTPLKIEAKK